jgi:flagellin
MVIGTNMSALNDAMLLQQSSQLLSQSLNRLSSGSKIISPADDAAGLGETMRFGGEELRNQAASNNLSNALSFQQTQDGYLANVTGALDRMSELSIQAQDVTKSDSDRALYNQEFQTLATYVNGVQNADFNGVSLFSGNALNVTDSDTGQTFALAAISANYLGSTPAQPVSASTTLGTLQPGLTDTLAWVGTSGHGAEGNDVLASTTVQGLVDIINTDATLNPGSASASYNATTGQLSVTVAAGSKLYFTNPSFPYSTQYSSLAGLAATDNTAGSSPVTVSATLTQGGSSGVGDINTISDAASALTKVKTAISAVASDRANIGAGMQRIQYIMSQLGTLNNNLSAASSRISDVDVAEESTTYARENILVQTGTAMLVQANSQPQSVLRLLGA